jgi:hypothetical protein
MENQLKMKLRFKAVLPMSSKTIHDSQIAFRYEDATGIINYCSSRDVIFDQDCKITTAADGIPLEQFE